MTCGATESAGKGAGSGPLPIISTRMGCLLDGLGRAYGVLEFADATARDEVFAQVVPARIIEPVSKPEVPRRRRTGLSRGGCAPMRRTSGVIMVT